MLDIFVISPYTSDKLMTIAYRVREANLYIGELTRKGKVAYSAISAMHHLLRLCKLPGDWNYWQHHCEQMMEPAQEVHVLCLDGWEESEGVRAEIEIAKGFNKPIRYIKKVERTKC